MGKMFASKLCAVLFLSLSLLMGHASEKPSSQTSSAVPNADACSLLTKEDILATQKDELQDKKASVVPSRGLFMQQCLYRTRNAMNSVTLVLAVSDPTRPAVKPSDFWNKRFHGGHEEHEEEEASRPRSVANVGDEAFWVGNALSGALYARRAERFIRVSVGGVRDLEERIERSKALARAALKKL